MIIIVGVLMYWVGVLSGISNHWEYRPIPFFEENLNHGPTPPGLFLNRLHSRVLEFSGISSPHVFFKRLDLGTLKILFVLYTRRAKC